MTIDLTNQQSTIPGEMSRTFRDLPDDQLWLLFDAYGWRTGHKVEIDYIKLEKLNKGKMLPISFLGSSNFLFKPVGQY